MKKILFSLFFFSILAVGLSAQKSTCSKPCTKSVASSSCHATAPSVASTISPENAVAAAKLASMDASIETRKDPASGTISYVKKETCAGSGHVSYVSVNYDAATNSFVNVSPVATTGTATGCGSKATTASGKSCCAAGMAAGKSCCAGKGAAASKSTEKVKS